MATRKQQDNRAVAGTKLAIRSKVLNTLAESHADEFHGLMEDEYEAAGLVYERPLSPREKAQQALADIYREFPELRPDVAQASPPRARLVDDEVDVSDDLVVAQSGVDPDIRSALG